MEENSTEDNTIINIIHKVDPDEYLNEEETKEFIQFIHDNFNDSENPVTLEEYERRIKLLNNGTVSKMQYEVLKACVNLNKEENI